MSAGVKSEQTAGFEPVASSRQDRNTIVTDGGVFTWNAFSALVSGASFDVTGSSSFTVGVNMVLGGVEVGDTLRVISGPNAGDYIIATRTAFTGTITSTFPDPADPSTTRVFQIGSGELSWDEILNIMVGGLGKSTVPAGSVKHVHGSQGSSPPRGVFILLDRSMATSVTLEEGDVDDANDLAADAKVLFGARGEDDRFYLTDGTVINDGASQALGAFQSEVERVEFESDGRVSPRKYALGNELATGSDGATDGTGFIFTSASATFLTSIPNSGAGTAPTTDAHVEIIGTDQVHEIATVDSDTQVMLATEATPHSTGGFGYRILHEMLMYVVGEDQLLLEVGGLAMIKGLHYDEVGTDGDTSTQIEFIASEEPGAGETITGINLAGAQGPQGPAGGQTLQEAYDAGGIGEGRDVEVPSGKPVDLHDDDDSGTTELLHGGKDSDRGLFKLFSDGGIQVPYILIGDGASSSFRIEGDGGNLLIKHLGTGEEVRIDQDGGIFSTTSGAEPSGSTGDGIRMAEYEGTLDTSLTNPTTISTGITTIKTVMFAVEDDEGDFWTMEVGLGSSSDQKLVVTYNSSGDIKVSSNVDKDQAVGAEFQGKNFRLIVCY